MTRFHSLLDLFGLQHCLFDENQSFEIPKINWGKINLILDQLRKESLFSLEQALNY